MATPRFLIECSCGHTFWRSKPCDPKGLRPWLCPRHRQTAVLPNIDLALGHKPNHQTRLASLTRQIQEAMNHA